MRFSLFSTYCSWTWCFRVFPMGIFSVFSLSYCLSQSSILPFKSGILSLSLSILLLRLPMTFFTFPIFAFGVTDSFSFSVSLVIFFFRTYMAFNVLFSCLFVFFVRSLFPLLISLPIVLILSSLSGSSFTSLFLYAITIGLVIFRRVLLF